jgi:hypothetical protein
VLFIYGLRLKRGVGRPSGQVLYVNQHYDAFLERAIMEKYFGSLVGRNLVRNLNVIYNFLGQNKMGCFN